MYPFADKTELPGGTWQCRRDMPWPWPFEARGFPDQREIYHLDREAGAGGRSEAEVGQPGGYRNMVKLSGLLAFHVSSESCCENTGAPEASRKPPEVNPLKRHLHAPSRHWAVPQKHLLDLLQ